MKKLKSKQIKHLGVVAAFLHSISFIHTIDTLLPEPDRKHQVSYGQITFAIVLNCLDFGSGCALSGFTHYMKQLPLEKLFKDKNIKAEYFTRDALARLLDALYDAKLDKCYDVIVMDVLKKLGLIPEIIHIDTTSIHMHGMSYSKVRKNMLSTMLVKHGYSRDHRPDLAQIVHYLMCEHTAGIPIMMGSLSGNQSDKTTFNQMLQSIIQGTGAAAQVKMVVADSAFYTPENIQLTHGANKHFITRVPMTLNDAQRACQAINHQTLDSITEGYSGYWLPSSYAGVPQKWLVIKSQPAYDAQMKTFEKNKTKQLALDEKVLKKLGTQLFFCEKDALKALEAAKKKLKLSVLNDDLELIEVPKYTDKGRPKAGTKPNLICYKISVSCQQSQALIESAKSTVGTFILSTNDTSDEMTMQKLLGTYKAQDKVESGFKLLKSNKLFADSIYLHRPDRIEALMMIRTLALIVYAALQHQIRVGLVNSKQKIIGHHRKSTDMPTAAYVLKLFSGVSIVEIIHVDDSTEPIMEELDEQAWKILRILGPNYVNMYKI